jgi:hypothetical protein
MACEYIVQIPIEGIIRSEEQIFHGKMKHEFQYYVRVLISSFGTSPACHKP